MKRLVVLFLVLAMGSLSYSQLAKKERMPLTTSSKAALASYNEAFRYFEDVDMAKGIELLQKALTEDPDFFMANYYMALMSMANDEKFKSFGDAAVNCKAKLSEAEKLIKSTMVSLLEKKDADVTAVGKKLVEMYPKDINAYWLLLNLQDIAGDTDGSHETLLKALEIAPNPAPVYNMLGYSYMRLNQNAKAEEAFDKYIQLAPDNPNVYDSKGDFYMNTREYKKAYDAYMKSNSLNPAWGLSKATKAKHIFEVEEPARIAVTALLDKYNRAFKAKDTGTLVSLMADGGMYCGTDPSEIWNKKQVATGFEQSFADPSLVIDYTVDKREILIAEDGKSAIGVEQAFYKFFSPNLAGRLVYHAVKSGEAWKFDFLSWSFVPRNEDIGKINKALVQ